VNGDENQGATSNDDEGLPFDVEREQLPVWVQISSALVVVTGILIAVRLVPMLVLLPFLVASSIGRRFASSATHVEVEESGLDLGGRIIPRSSIVDVWVDDDATEPRATVALGENTELAVLHFENREQALRFGEALALKDGAAVAGHRPVPADLLASLRFVAIAAAFVATGSWYGLFILVFFAFGAWNVVRAKQVVAFADRFTLHGLLGSRSYPYADIASVDVDAGVIALKDGSEVVVPRSSIRDTTLAAPAWLERAHARTLEQIRKRARNRQVDLSRS
jgi:hypothetical protein